jgi:hypothetical protein
MHRLTLFLIIVSLQSAAFADTFIREQPAFGVFHFGTSWQGGPAPGPSDQAVMGATLTTVFNPITSLFLLDTKVSFADTVVSAQLLTDSNALTPNQKNEVSEALRALRKMVSITKAGLSQREYASRVLDMAATVDESLRNIPDSQLKAKIVRSKEVYVKANSEWDNSLREVNKTFLQIMWEIGERNLKEAEAIFQTGRLNP